MDNTGNPGTNRNSTSEMARVTYDWTTTEPSLAILETIAEIKDIDPLSLFAEQECTLTDYVDPDALEILLADNRRNIEFISFRIEDYTVRITEDELIVVHFQS